MKYDVNEEGENYSREKIYVPANPVTTDIVAYF